MKKQERKRGEHKGGTLATSLWRTGGGDLYDKIFIWFYGCIFHSLSSLGVCTQIWILWEPPLDQPNDCLSAISEPSVFLSRQMLCFAKRGQVQLCLIARFHTRICELTQTDTHTHTYRTHTSPRWLINSLHSKLNSMLHLRSQISAPFLFSFPTLKITFIKVITLLLPELQINERRAVSSTAPLWECYLFLSEKKRNTDIILVAANYVNQSPELI